MSVKAWALAVLVGADVWFVCRTKSLSEKVLWESFCYCRHCITLVKGFGMTCGKFLIIEEQYSVCIVKEIFRLCLSLSEEC